MHSFNEAPKTPAPGKKGGRHMPGQWIVLMEATDAGAPGTVDRDGVLRLLAEMERGCNGGGGGALHSSDRYALQLATTASDPAEALIRVLSQWADALIKLNLPTWKVVRTEVLTAEERERDEQNHLDMPNRQVNGPWAAVVSPATHLSAAPALSHLPTPDDATPPCSIPLRRVKRNHEGAQYRH